MLTELARRGFVLVVAAAVLAGCDKPAEERPTGQIVATVNGSEITYLQLNHLLQSSGADASRPAAKRSAVDALIERELLVQEALNAKLDRDAEVLQAIDAARRQILVDAYARRLVYPGAAIGEGEKKAYYAAHPELFQQRRAYDLTVFQVDSAAVAPPLLEALNGARNPEATRRVLDAANVAYTERRGEQAAEQLPLSMVQQFAAAAVGDILVAAQEQSTNLMQITAIADKPVQYADAAPLIEQYLTGTRNRDAMQARLKQLREGARIAYAAEFAPDQAFVSASAPAK